MRPFIPGAVGHFGLAVRDPQAEAAWFRRVLLFEPYMETDDAVAVGNDATTIWFWEGEPSPETVGHISFQLRDRAELERALEHLKREGAKLEDPGDEIGPMSPGSEYIGIWFRDPEGYRWELSTKG
jgi:catechol 2,3-dioxygenase-like lactoylglutathione lyase family enzyme